MKELKQDDLIKSTDKAIDVLRQEIASGAPTTKRIIIEKFILAALGSIPWVGGFLSAAASLKTDRSNSRMNNLQTQWLEGHSKKIEELWRTLEEISQRFEHLGAEIDERIQSEEYLKLVRYAFRSWDKANTQEKRKYLGNLIANAAGIRLCSDDVIRLFIDWLDHYHEVYFSVIREIFQNPGSTRYEIWVAIYGEDLPREDSAEADLFKLLIRDLSTGGVIRQERDINHLGQFVRQRSGVKRRKGGSTLESAFEDTKPYTLTDLGKQFVHYAMNDVVQRIKS